MLENIHPANVKTGLHGVNWKGIKLWKIIVKGTSVCKVQMKWLIVLKSEENPVKSGFRLHVLA